MYVIPMSHRLVWVQPWRVPLQKAKSRPPCYAMLWGTHMVSVTLPLTPSHPLLAVMSRRRREIVAPDPAGPGRFGQLDSQAAAAAENSMGMSGSLTLARYRLVHREPSRPARGMTQVSCG